jgi:hypothetical protein
MSGRSQGLKSRPREDGELQIPPSSLAQTPVLAEEVPDWLVTHAQHGYADEDVDAPAREREAAVISPVRAATPSVVGQAISHSQPSAKPLLARPISQPQRISGTLPPVSSPRR